MGAVVISTKTFLSIKIFQLTILALKWVVCRFFVRGSIFIFLRGRGLSTSFFKENCSPKSSYFWINVPVQLFQHLEEEWWYLPNFGATSLTKDHHRVDLTLVHFMGAWMYLSQQLIAWWDIFVISVLTSQYKGVLHVAGCCFPFLVLSWKIVSKAKPQQVYGSCCIRVVRHRMTGEKRNVVLPSVERLVLG